MVVIVIRFIVFLSGLVFFPAALAFAYQGALFLLYKSDAEMQLVGIGFLVYVALFALVAVLGGYPSIRFLQVFEHELIHAVLAKLFFWRVTSFQVLENGGGLTGTQHPPALQFGFPFVIMGPYFFPLFTIPLLIAFPFASSSLTDLLSFLIGFTLAFHYVGLLAEFRIHQPDLQMVGLPWALNLTLFFNAVFIVIVMATVQQDWDLFGDFISASLESAQEFYEIILVYVRNILYDP